MTDPEDIEEEPALPVPAETESEREQLCASLRWALQALAVYGRPLDMAHPGACGPDAGCDCTCVELASFAHHNEVANKALARAEARLALIEGVVLYYQVPRLGISVYKGEVVAISPNGWCAELEDDSGHKEWRVLADLRILDYES